MKEIYQNFIDMDAVNKERAEKAAKYDALIADLREWNTTYSSKYRGSRIELLAILKKHGVIE